MEEYAKLFQNQKNNISNKMKKIAQVIYMEDGKKWIINSFILKWSKLAKNWKSDTEIQKGAIKIEDSGTN